VVGQSPTANHQSLNANHQLPLSNHHSCLAASADFRYNIVADLNYQSKANIADLRRKLLTLR
jgi:hypothetical protein